MPEMRIAALLLARRGISSQHIRAYGRYVFATELKADQDARPCLVGVGAKLFAEFNAMTEVGRNFSATAIRET